jgi:hypothetical protein
MTSASKHAGQTIHNWSTSLSKSLSWRASLSKSLSWRASEQRICLYKHNELLVLLSELRCLLPAQQPVNGKVY